MTKSRNQTIGNIAMASDRDGNDEGLSRRKVLECMTWAGTGVLWTVAGGVPKSLSLLGRAEAATAAAQSFTFVQISDSHAGFHDPHWRHPPSFDAGPVRQRGADHRLRGSRRAVRAGRARPPR